MAGDFAIFPCCNCVSGGGSLFLWLLLVSHIADDDSRKEIPLFLMLAGRRIFHCICSGNNCTKNFIENRKKAVFFHGIQV